MAQRLKTDWILFFTIIVMVCFGLVIVYSASSIVAELKFNSTVYFIKQQLIWAVVSFLVFMFFRNIDYRRFKAPIWAFAPLGVTVALLLIVYFADPGRHRWLRIAGHGIQPSEFAKPALAIFLAYFVTLRIRAINDQHPLAPALAALGVLSGMVVIADFGTAVVLGLTAAVAFYVAGLERRY